MHVLAPMAAGAREPHHAVFFWPRGFRTRHKPIHAATSSRGARESRGHRLPRQAIRKPVRRYHSGRWRRRINRPVQRRTLALACGAFHAVLKPEGFDIGERRQPRARTAATRPHLVERAIGREPVTTYCDRLPRKTTGSVGRSFIASAGTYGSGNTIPWVRSSGPARWSLCFARSDTRTTFCRAGLSGNRARPSSKIAALLLPLLIELVSPA